MNCDTNKIESYFDGQLNAEERRAVESHLHQCAHCAGLLNDLKSLSQLISVASLPEPSSQSIQHFHSAWPAARDRSILKISSWMTAAAAAVLFGALLLWPAPQVPTVMAKSNEWETAAIIPPTEPVADVDMEFMQVAQWMAADLSLNEGQ